MPLPVVVKTEGEWYLGCAYAGAAAGRPPDGHSGLIGD
jgi:hypothetical protein